MKIILIANVISLIGSIIMVSIGLIQTKKNILIAQSCQLLFMGTANLMLGGVTGFVADLVSIVRNITASKVIFDTKYKIGFIVLIIGVSLPFNTNGILGLIPIICGIIFTLVLDQKDERILKVAIIIAQILFTIYDTCILNYVGSLFDVMTIVSNMIGIYMLFKKKESIN